MSLHIFEHTRDIPTDLLWIQLIGQENGISYFLDEKKRWLLMLESYWFLKFQTDIWKQYSFDQFHRVWSIKYSEKKWISEYIVIQVWDKFYAYEQFLSHLYDLEWIPNIIWKEKYFSDLDSAKKWISLWEQKLKIFDIISKIH